MSIELEDSIMNEIGLGAHFSYFNGSGSCYCIRNDAAKKIEAAILKKHQEGKEIDKPNSDLCNLVSDVAAHADDSQYSLTKTWQVSANVIRAHIEAFYLQEKDRKEHYQQYIKHINERFLNVIGVGRRNSQKSINY